MMRTTPQIRIYLYITFALIMLIMSWEANLASAALTNSTIPEQAIRIRILANSDRVEDQWIKKEIRDAITASVSSWSLESKNIEDARSEVNNHLPELNALVDELLSKYGFEYGYQVELGNVYFPAKTFGHTTYPAGEYEALRVTLGAGQGQNWWCVLFPPLCFGSAVKANAVDGIIMGEEDKVTEGKQGKQKVEQVEQEGHKGQEKQEEHEEHEEQEGHDMHKIEGANINSPSGKSIHIDDERDVSSDNAKSSRNSTPVYQAPVQDGDDVEVKFFVWEKLKQTGGFIKGLFA